MPDWFDFSGAAAALAPDPLARLLPVMEAHRVQVSPAAFHSAVKIAFFESSAESYEEVSQNFALSLPEQFQRLASDYLSQYAPASNKMTALDVGCGAGLSSEILLQTRFGAFVRQVDLLDPSQQMLDVCGARESLRAIRHRPIRGTIQDLPARSHYDLILAGCVLQHIPELPEFLYQVSLRQRPGGIFLHVQDPNADYLDDFERLERVARLARRLRVQPSTLLKRLSAARPWHRKGETYVDRVNRELLRQNIIATKMADAEIRIVVDLPAHDGRGVSIRRMREFLPDYTLVSCRSYAFFGELISDLPPAYRRLEQALAAQHAMNGSQIAAIWMKTLRPKP